MNDPHFSKAFLDRMERIHREQVERAFGLTTGVPTQPPDLTIESLEQAIRDVDPDGRMLLQARLLAAIGKLDNGQIELVIRFAEHVGEVKP